MTGRRQCWLVKSEPEAFSWDQQVANGVEPWTGVRNHTAKNNLKAMRVGDRAFFYHSNTGKEIVGVVEVARARRIPTPPPRAATGSASTCARSGRCRARSGWRRSRPTPALADLALVRQSRLSVLPVSAAHWAALCRMGGWTADRRPAAPRLRRLCAEADIPEGGAKGFPPPPGGFTGLFAVRAGGRIAVYVNACPHLGVPLDWAPDRFLSVDGRHIVCATHGALFRIAGRRLRAWPLLRRGAGARVDRDQRRRDLGAEDAAL